eukprot:m51a1_g4907 xanthine phosphoribosyltransferase, putative (174) ;mRNA; r:175113-176223
MAALQLKQRVQEEGRNLGNGILKLAARFEALHPTRVLTAETSGIVPGLTTAAALRVPVVYARKVKPVTMCQGAYEAHAPSHTKGGSTPLVVSKEFMCPGDRVLVVDDFLAKGATMVALGKLVQEAGCILVGFATLIEKEFEGGRKAIQAAFPTTPVEVLVSVVSMDNGSVQLK